MTELSDYDDTILVPGGEKIPCQSKISQTSQTGDHEEDGVIVEDDSTCEIDEMKQEMGRLRSELSTLKSYCGNLEAEKNTLEDEI